MEKARSSGALVRSIIEIIDGGGTRQTSSVNLSFLLVSLGAWEGTNIARLTVVKLGFLHSAVGSGTVATSLQDAPGPRATSRRCENPCR